MLIVIALALVSGGALAAVSPIPAPAPAECESGPAAALPPEMLRPCEEWEAAWSPGGELPSARGRDVLVSPDGSRVHVFAYAGHVYLNGTEPELEGVVLTYDAASGELLWSYRQPWDGWDHGMDVSPDGSRLFVAFGDSAPSVVAFDAATGAVAWDFTHPEGWDSFVKVLADPLGLRVYLLEYAGGVSAFHSFTGERLWSLEQTDVERLLERHLPEGTLPSTRQRVVFNGDIAASPDGTRLFLAGNPWTTTFVMSFRALTGHAEWATLVPESPGFEPMYGPTYVGASPDGASAVTLVATTDGVGLLQHDAVTGDEVRRVALPIEGDFRWCRTAGLVVADLAHAAGTCYGFADGYWNDATLLASVGLADGELAWERRIPEYALGLDASEDGSALIMNHWYGFTVHDAASGAVRWDHAYWAGGDWPYPDGDDAALSPDAGRVYFTGGRNGWPETPPDARTWARDVPE